MIKSPIIITDSPTVTMTPKPGTIIATTRVPVEALIEAVKQPGCYVQLTDYTLRALEIDHGIRLTTNLPHDGGIYVSHRTYNVIASPLHEAEVYLTEER